MAMRKNNLLSVAVVFALFFTYTAIVTATILGNCKMRDIQVLQFDNGTYPNGIPKFRVQISNTCINPSCTISDIIVHCGQFAAVRLVSPLEFRRIDHDNCLVNNGEPISHYDVVAFSYGNTLSYPLSIVSAKIKC